jgi:uncharacterized lipoprotein YmbA
MRRWLILGAALVSGCTALSAQEDRTRYFILKPLAVPERQPVSGFARSVGLGPFAIPDHLEAMLVTRLADNQITISDTDRWAEPLHEGLSTALRQDLIRLLGTERIVIYPWESSAQPDLAVRVEVLQFERTRRGTVELAARWSVERGSDRTPIVTEETRVSKPVRGTDSNAAAMALSSAVLVLSRNIAAAIRSAP